MTMPEEAKGMWSPIETAPKDGTKIDLWVRQVNSEKWREIFKGMTGSLPSREYRQPDCWWSGDAWVYKDYDIAGDQDERTVESDDWTGTVIATHWLPLPPPPATQEQGG